MGEVSKWAVTKLSGITCAAGRFGPGEFVYDPWLNGQASGLQRRGHLVLAGKVDETDVPDVALVGVPDWSSGAGGPVLVPSVGTSPSPVDDDDVTAPVLIDPAEPDDTGAGDGDPTEISEAELVAVLAGATPSVMAWADEHPGEAQRLLDLETAGQARKGVSTFLADLVAAQAGDDGDEDDA